MDEKTLSAIRIVAMVGAILLMWLSGYYIGYAHAIKQCPIHPTQVIPYSEVQKMNFTNISKINP